LSGGATGDLTADCYDADIEYSRIGAETPGLEGRWLGRDELATSMRDYPARDRLPDLAGSDDDGDLVHLACCSFWACCR